MIINYFNIEEVLLSDNNLMKKLSSVYNDFNNYKVGQSVPTLRVLVQKSKLDILNKLTQEDIAIIKSHLKLNELSIEKIDYSTIKNYQTSTDKLNDLLNNENLLNWQFCLSRNGNQLYLSFWR